MIMEDLLYGISSLFDGLFSGGGIPTQAENGWALTLMFAAAGALILTRFTGTVGALTSTAMFPGRCSFFHIFICALGMSRQE